MHTQRKNIVGNNHILRETYYGGILAIQLIVSNNIMVKYQHTMVEMIHHLVEISHKVTIVW